MGIPEVFAMSPYYGGDKPGTTQKDVRELLQKVCWGEAEMELTPEMVDTLLPSTTCFSRPRTGRMVAEYSDRQYPNVVNLGCSTGLECYWTAHYLRSQGRIAQDENTILGIDVNESALKIARRGSYERWYYDKRKSGFHDFDRLEGDFTDFERSALIVRGSYERVEFDPRLKPLVKFESANLLDRDRLIELVGEGSADVITIMNVLKYLSPEAVRTVMDNALALLAEGGILILDNGGWRSLVDYDKVERVEGKRGLYKPSTT